MRIYFWHNLQILIQNVYRRVRKLLNARLFDNEKKWNASVKDKQYEILCISQFTLCYQFKSNKLTFHRAMETEKSKEMYGKFLSELKSQYDSSKIFGKTCFDTK